MFACRANAFLGGSSDSDNDEDRRIVKSARDKRLSELASCCDEIRVRPM